MSTDTFEDILRDLLRDTADAAGPGYVEPDAAQVIGLGRRVVRRRRYATGLVAASIAGIAGVVGMAAFGPGFDGAAPQAGTSSAAPSSPGLVIADLGQGPNESPHGTPGSGEPAMVRVTVDRATGHITYFAGRSGYVVPIGSGQLPSEQPGANWKTFEDEAGVVIGIIPAAAHGHAVAISDPTGDSSSTAVDLVGTDFQAVAIWPGEGSNRLTGVTWSVGTATYGATADQALRSPDDSDVVFTDGARGVMGFYSAGSSTTRQLSGVPDGALPTMVIGRVPTGSDTSATTLLAVLPPGAREVKGIATPNGSAPSVEALPTEPSRDTLVVVTVTVPAWAKVSGLDGLTWTNADGSPGSGVVDE